MLERRPDLLVSIENLPTTYTGEIEALKTFLLERGKWMDENIEQLLKWAE
jgi:hypothetical protein